MKVPAITGVIDRRMLINYQVDPDVLARMLPAPFRPRLVKGVGVAGICLIRLKAIRPKFFPLPWGISSENGAHRIAVTWEEKGALKEGVFIPRRDTSSRWNAIAGGRLFPGVHHHAKFTVNESNNAYHVAFKSEDGTRLSVSATVAEAWNANSIFEDQSCASAFFKNGSVGYSPGRIAETFVGIELKTQNWAITPLSVSAVSSSFFENASVFPQDSIRFDNALLMRNILHDWEAVQDLTA